LANGGNATGRCNAMRTVLIVEDEILIRMVLAEHLRGCGYRVIEAGRAHEALDVLDSATPVDVLLTDVALPGGMNGFELTRLAREARPALNIIVTSGTAQAAADLCDGYPYFQKPYDLGAVEREIRAVAGPLA
jgi:CheY-like chemotaxis protein